MKIFMAGFHMETNTFSPIPTGMRAFEEVGISRGDASQHPPTSNTGLVLHWEERARRDGHTVLEGLIAGANPAGRIQKVVYESLRDELLSGLLNALPVDIVLLALHGAMVADGYDDCEGDLLQRIRRIVGDACIVAAEIDPHCHSTQTMFESANLIVAYKEYPHTDIVERGDELFELAISAAKGEIRPTTELFDCRIVGSFHTTRQPMRGFVDAMKQAEKRDRVLSVNLGHGFAWADVSDVGARVWVITDGNRDLAAQVAAEFGRGLFVIRSETQTKLATIDEVIAAANGTKPGLIVVADTADNAGGGSPSDSTFVLRALLKNNVKRAAVGVLWDPIAVQFCIAAGVGSNLSLRVGGKVGPTSGEPLDLAVTIMNIGHDHGQTGLAGAEYPYGPSAWIRTQGIDVVLSTLRQQVFHPEAFTRLGIQTDSLGLIVVKSSQHFYAGFESIADEVMYVSTPGTMNQSYESLPYTKRDPNYWPRVENPFGK